MSNTPLAVVRSIVEMSALRDCLYLISKGIPYDIAFSLDATERTAWCVIFGELDGGTFNWSSGAWERPREK